MAILAYVGEEPSGGHDRFDAMDHKLEQALRGVATLQDSTIVNGYGQWIIGSARGENRSRSQPPT
jgi:hypothetical protein